jgi:glycosyltransferase involved in cell wall biosynthesis
LWATSEAKTLNQPFDLLIATSMVDLAGLRGFVPALSTIPTLVYFHENQFAYPAGEQQRENVEHQLVPLYSALCADAIVFNSQFNRQTFLEGARSLIQRLPENFPDSILDKLQNSQVIPVPIDTRALKQDPEKDTGSDSILEVIWNHRWEYDKGIELLLALLKQVAAQQLPLRFHIVGEQFRQQPPQFVEIDQALTEHGKRTGIPRGSFGFVPERNDYLALLQRCDVVLSTALHDFQGLAVQEAVVAGCTPLTPADLVYPEYLQPEFLFSRAPQHQATVPHILHKLLAWQQLKASHEKLPVAGLEHYSLDNVCQQYAGLFESMGLTD